MSPRSFVTRYPYIDGKCSQCGHDTFVPAARFETWKGEAYAFELDPPPITIATIMRRRALLEASDQGWSDLRRARQLGRRLKPLEDTTPRRLTSAEYNDVWRRFRREDDERDIIMIGVTANIDAKLVHSIPSILELLGLFRDVGTGRSMDPPAVEKLGPPFTDTFTGGAVVRGRRLASLRLISAEDHLCSLAETLLARRPSTCFLIARACAELAAQALWLIDSTDPRQIVARYLADRWDGRRALSLFQQEAAQQLREQATTEARGLESEGFTVGWQDGWPRQVEGIGKTNYMEQVAACFPRREMGEVAYRMLSTFAHGTEHGLEDLLATVEGREVLRIDKAHIAEVIRLALWPYLVAIERFGVIVGMNVHAPADLARSILASLDQLIADFRVDGKLDSRSS